MKEKVLELIKNITPDLNNLSLEIYNNPELGYEEYEACRLHTELLQKYGFDVQNNFSGVPTGFKAEYKSGKPGLTIAYMAEYDALPGIGHGCGHNLLGTVSTGAGIVLKQLVDEIGGNVIVFGTPAEETSGAKVTYVENHEFDNVDIAMMAHPGSEYAKSGSSLALEPVQFEFFGKTAHAAASPEKGVNALDAAIQTFNSINALREHIKSDSRVHGVIINGGKAANIVPDYSKSQFYVRSTSKTYNLELLEKIKNCAKGAALSTGCELKITKYEFSYDNMVTNETLSEIFSEKIFQVSGITMNEPAKNTGSIDAGQVSQVCPTIHPYFDITNNKNIAGHTKEMAENTLTEYAKEQMKNTVAALVLTAAEVMHNKELYKKIKIEFDNAEK
ncbi:MULTISPECIES: M20 family metallopeptidase [unclassified Sedimentibacter]|uniref:M20 family metallopeptidase n=1 Tax=unclassified Sedimentibacter TaxID=2649220 RepID=UPI0027DEFFC5|nr:M20 family metallopeptidase [Sedimentibacter sp. MB35-C1]WMJ77173.1 M20 family metallopeptidase [Sedimentibacter sp. MB35-C1]